jgi:hypothetical protein
MNECAVMLLLYLDRGKRRATAVNPIRLRFSSTVAEEPWLGTLRLLSIITNNTVQFMGTIDIDSNDTG